MCGASDSQKQIGQAQTNFYNELTAEHKTDFADYRNILGSLESAFAPILAKGPDQEGFGEQELTALHTQATEKVAGDVKKAQEFVQGTYGTGDTSIPQGQEEAALGGVASAGVKESADLNTKITEDDYATGRENYWHAASGLAGVAGLENPVGSAQAANQGGEAASKTANEIAAAGNAWMGPVFSAVGGIAGAAIGKIPTGGSGGEDA